MIQFTAIFFYYVCLEIKLTMDFIFIHLAELTN